MFLVSGAFRLDCFAFISKSAIPFEEWSAFRNLLVYAPFQDELNNALFSFGSNENSRQNPSVTNSFGAFEWILASQCTGFVSSKYRFSSFEQHLCMIDVENQRNRMRRPHVSLYVAHHDIGQ